MRLKFFAIAAAASMVVTSTAAIAAAPFAASPLDQRPSQLKVSHRKGEKLEDGSAVQPPIIIGIIATISIIGGAVILANTDNEPGASPS